MSGRINTTPSKGFTQVHRRNIVQRKLIALSLFVVAVAAIGCSKQPLASPAAPLTSVQVVAAKQTDLRQALTYAGDVKSVSDVSVMPKQSGRIVSMPVDVGSKVQAGDVIAQLEHSTLDLSVESAQAQLQTAQARLDTVKAGPRTENVRQAELNLDVAQSRLQTLLNGAKAASVTQAQLAVDTAQQRLDALQAGSRVEAIAQAQANVTSAQARLQALKNGPRPEDIASSQLAVTQAQNSLYSTQISRDGSCAPQNPGYLCKAANAAVNAAQSGVDIANANLKSKVAAPTTTDLQQAQAAVDQAQAALDLAQKPYTAQDLKTAQDAVDQAKAGLTLASEPFTDEDIRQARDAADTAQQQLNLAKAPFTDQDLETAQAGVAQAQVAVDQAQQAIKDASILAPIDGVISQKLLNIGAMASPAQAVVVMSGGGIKVTVPAEETQVSNLKIGQDASITAAVLGDQTVAAKITNIAPSGDAQNRTFAVDVVPQTATDALLPGMFVQVTLSAVEHKGIVAVPAQAIIERAGKFYVFTVESNVAKLTPVTVGLTDGKLTEVSGLTAGASVVVLGQDQIADGDKVTPVAAAT
jgi:HlyD family secretion protein